jgi:hypothetical protein
MGRIFTFGCSFTEYSWPTWADMILYKREGVNYGICGGGYEQIMSSLVQCDIDYKLTKDDYIFIVYPNFLRWDAPTYPKWLCYGNAITSPWLESKDKLWNIEGMVYKNLNWMYMINEFLLHKGVTFRYGSITKIFKYLENYFFDDYQVEGDVLKHLKYIESHIPLLTDFYTDMYGDQNDDNQWKSTKVWKDRGEYHPRPKHHYGWLKNVLLPTLDIDVNLTLSNITTMENIIDSSDEMNVVEEQFSKTDYNNNRKDWLKLKKHN